MDKTDTAAKAKHLEGLREVKSELKELRRRYPASDCKGNAYVNPKGSCTFAENAELVYYTEIGIGPGTIGPFEPRVERDITVRCTGGSPHKCTGRSGVAIYFP